MTGDFNTLLTAMGRPSRQKINEETHTLKDILNQIDLTGSYRTFHPKEEEYILSSEVHMEHSSRQITSWAIDKALVHF